MPPQPLPKTIYICVSLAFSQEFMTFEPSKDENYSHVSESRPVEEAFVELVSTDENYPPKVHSTSPTPEQASPLLEDHESTLPEVPLTTVDDVVKYMTDFELFGDGSKHMDKDQETSPKSPVPNTVTQNEDESPHTSSPPLQKDSAPYPLLHESETSNDVSSILPSQKGTSGAADKDDEQMHTVNDDETK